MKIGNKEASKFYGPNAAKTPKGAKNLPKTPAPLKTFKTGIKKAEIKTPKVANAESKTQAAKTPQVKNVNSKTPRSSIKLSTKTPKASKKPLWSEIVAKNAKKTPKLAAATKLVAKAKIAKVSKKVAPPKTPKNKHLSNVLSTGHAASPETLVIGKKKVAAVKTTTPVKKGIKRKSAITPPAQSSKKMKIGTPTPKKTPVKAGTPKKTPVKATTPKTKTPAKTATPKVKTPSKETPKAKTPKATTPKKMETPKSKTPAASKTPMVETPEKGFTPNVKTPKDSILDSTPSVTPKSAAKKTPAKTPGFSTPAAETPDMFATPSETPKVKTPKFQTPKTSLPSKTPKSVKSAKSVTKKLGKTPQLAKSVKKTTLWSEIVKKNLGKTPKGVKVSRATAVAVSKALKKKPLKGSKTPKKTTKSLLSTGHAASPATIVITKKTGKAKNEEVITKKGRKSNVNKNAKITHDNTNLEGVAEMLKTPAKNSVPKTPEIKISSAKKSAKKSSEKRYPENLSVVATHKRMSGTPKSLAKGRQSLGATPKMAVMTPENKLLNRVKGTPKSAKGKRASFHATPSKEFLSQSLSLPGTPGNLDT